MKNKYYDISDILKLRIALMSDIHYSKNFNPKIFNKIILNLKQNSPDYICIPGDIVENARVLENNNFFNIFKGFFKELSNIAPVIISIGNHDYVEKKAYVYVGIQNILKCLGQIENVYILDNDYLKIDDITFVGLTNNFNYYYKEPYESTKIFNEDLKKLPNAINKYNILLCHSPFNIAREANLKPSIKKFNLILCGHMHNGLVPHLIDKYLKGNSGLVGPFSNFCPKYARGRITKCIGDKKINLIISSGITKISNIKWLGKITKPFYPSVIEYINI